MMNLKEGDLNTLEEQLILEYQMALEIKEEYGPSAQINGMVFAYESLLSLLQLRDKKQYITRKNSIFYREDLA